MIMSSLNPETFKAYTRKCWIVFAAVASATLVMVAASYLPGGGRKMIGLVLAVALFNASLVAGYLMHLISEKKAIYALLAFTVFFFIGLMGLSWWASFDLPAPR
jgi:general stress protein CsbA